MPGLLQPSCSCERDLPSLPATPNPCWSCASPAPKTCSQASCTFCFIPHALQVVQCVRLKWNCRSWWLGRINKAAPEQQVPSVLVQTCEIPVLICCWQNVFHTGFVLGSSALLAALQIRLLGLFLLDLFFQDFDIYRFCQCFQLHNHYILPGEGKAKEPFYSLFLTLARNAAVQLLSLGIGYHWSWLVLTGTFWPQTSNHGITEWFGLSLKGHHFQPLLWAGHLH